MQQLWKLYKSDSHGQNPELLYHFYMWINVFMSLIYCCIRKSFLILWSVEVIKKMLWLSWWCFLSPGAPLLRSCTFIWQPHRAASQWPQGATCPIPGFDLWPHPTPLQHWSPSGYQDLSQPPHNGHEVHLLWREVSLPVWANILLFKSLTRIKHDLAF